MTTYALLMLWTGFAAADDMAARLETTTAAVHRSAPATPATPAAAVDPRVEQARSLAAEAEYAQRVAGGGGLLAESAQQLVPPTHLLHCRLRRHRQRVRRP